MNDEILTQVKSELETFSGQISEKIKNLEQSASKEVKEQIESLQKIQTEYTGKVKELEDAFKKMNEPSVPGLKEELEKNPFSWTSFVGGLLKSANPNAPGHNDPWKDAGHEKEICEEYAKTKANYADDGSLGGFLIPPEVSSEIISLVKAATPILQMGVTQITGLYGDLPVPKVTGRPTTYWLGENEAPTESQATYGQVILRPKKIGAFTKQSQRLVYQSRGVSDQVIKEQLSDALSLGIHQGLVNGSGVDGEPKGIRTFSGDFTTSTAGVNADGYVNTNGDRFKIDDAGVMEEDIDNANELNEAGSFGYLMHPRVRGGLRRERVLQYSGQAARDAQPILAINPLMSNAMLEETLGYMVRSSTQIPATETRGSSSTCSSVLFGNWKMFWIAFWRDLLIKVSDTAGNNSGSAFLNDQMWIVAFQEIDSQLMRGSAFTMVQGADTNKTNWTS